MGHLELINIKNSPQRTAWEQERADNLAVSMQWRNQIMAGNKALLEMRYFAAHTHYRFALDVGKKNLDFQQYYVDVPENLIPAIVVAYLNICDLWKAQHKKEANKSYLLEVFDYLFDKVNKRGTSAPLQKQILQGLDKVLIEISMLEDIELFLDKKERLQGFRINSVNQLNQTTFKGTTA